MRRCMQGKEQGIAPRAASAVLHAKTIEEFDGTIRPHP
jgi:hypothetical protein